MEHPLAHEVKKNEIKLGKYKKRRKIRGKDLAARRNQKCGEQKRGNGVAKRWRRIVCEGVGRRQMPVIDLACPGKISKIVPVVLIRKNKRLALGVEVFCNRQKRPDMEKPNKKRDNSEDGRATGYTFGVIHKSRNHSQRPSGSRSVSRYHAIVCASPSARSVAARNPSACSAFETSTRLTGIMVGLEVSNTILASAYPSSSRIVFSISLTLYPLPRPILSASYRSTFSTAMSMARTTSST